MNDFRLSHLEYQLSRLALENAASRSTELQPDTPFSTLNYGESNLEQVIDQKQYIESEQAGLQFAQADRAIYSTLQMNSRRSHRKTFFIYSCANIGVLILMSSVEPDRSSRFGIQNGSILTYTARFIPSGIFLKAVGKGFDFSYMMPQSKAPGRFFDVQFSLRVYPVVPSNASIFEACKLGNIEWMKSIFDRQEASPFVKDTRGWTPLHVRFCIIGACLTLSRLPRTGRDTKLVSYY
jgi:hypothetical protein